ncbi:DegT/DnrJ/EryC1/StrS family aminotransferase [Candidatus Margulisiibacteriota bacterium]
MKIPFVDLKAQYRSIKEEIDAAMQCVIENTSFVMGEEVEAFEKEFAQFCEAKFAIGVSSGTDALHLALLACGVRPGDEVITVPNTFIATTEPISHCGARPVFVDINPKTYNIDVGKIEARITPKTKAIIPVHLYGQPTEMDPIIALARKHNLKVVEDACQAHGAAYKGKRVGGIGDLGCFSFYPGKNLGAYGDGGMITTNNDELARKARLLRNHGREDKYQHLIEGYCHRLDNLQAAILRAKLKRLDAWNGARRRAAKLYNNLLSGSVVIPYEPNWAKGVYHLYVVRVKERSQLQLKLKEKDIATGVHYPLALHLQPAYQHLGCKRGDFPVAETAQEEILSLPIYPEITPEQINCIAMEVKANVF